MHEEQNEKTVVGEDIWKRVVVISTSFRGIHFAAHKRITFLARLFRGNPDYASEKSFFFFGQRGKE